MIKQNEIKIFEDKKVRSLWDEEQEKWYISIVDVVAVLTDSPNPRMYWSVLKTRLKAEGSQLTTNCSQLKMQSADGKFYLTDVADTEQLFRLVQSIPSPKAEPFKRWLAKVATERLDEIQDPELSIDRALEQYLHLGYSENWINQRLKSIEIRKELTDEWRKRGLKEGVQFATLTDIITKAWSDKSTKEYKVLNLLFNIDHFTKLRKLNQQWFHRFFISTGITTQINPVFNSPLFLNSIYGLPYFNPENINADFRSTIKMESVFYNLKKILGFRFAPFIFSDVSLLKPVKENFNKSDLFTGIGGGVRTRNENLVFGTIELKGYYFPRTNGDMRGWKVEINTNIRFKYNSTFIKRPDFVVAN